LQRIDLGLQLRADGLLRRHGSFLRRGVACTFGINEIVDVRAKILRFNSNDGNDAISVVLR
jgi:hypothetical protein